MTEVVIKCRRSQTEWRGFQSKKDAMMLIMPFNPDCQIFIISPTLCNWNISCTRPRSTCFKDPLRNPTDVVPELGVKDKDCSMAWMRSGSSIYGKRSEKFGFSQAQQEMRANCAIHLLNKPMSSQPKVTINRSNVSGG